MDKNERERDGREVKRRHRQRKIRQRERKRAHGELSIKCKKIK